MHMGHDSLSGQLETFKAGFLARLPPAEREVVIAGSGNLHADAATPHSLQVGEGAPDFTLPDEHGRTVRLSDRLAHGPVVLLFLRGAWCPFCTLTARAYQAALPQIQALGGDLLAITPQPPRSCSAMTERDLLAFPTLSDHGNRVAERYGGAYAIAPAVRPTYQRLGHDLPRLNGTGDWRVPLPATYIVGQDGRVVHAQIETAPHLRMEPAEVIRILRGLTPAAESIAGSGVVPDR